MREAGGGQRFSRSMKRKGIAALSAIALAVTTASWWAPTTAQAAGSVDLGTVEARMLQQFGTTSTGVPSYSDDCLNYSPRTGTAKQSDWVTSAGEALTGHGGRLSTCPNLTNTRSQSALGFTPTSATTLTLGQPMSLGVVTHYNNPIQAERQWFKGTFEVQVPGLNKTFKFPWLMHETPNTPGDVDDVTTITVESDPQVVWVNHLPYRMTVQGFNEVNADGTCSANAVPNDQFITRERATTRGCMIASLEQVRQLVIHKEAVNVPEGVAAPDVSFATTTTVNGNPWWDGKSVSLTPTELQNGVQKYTTYPTNTTPPSQDNPNADGYLMAPNETVTVTETVPAGWSLKKVECVNGAGQTETAATIDGNTATIKASAVDSFKELPIHCTFTNAPDMKPLTIKKTVDARSFVRDYAWKLAKSVNPDGTEDAPAASGTTFGYTVTATPDGMTDRDFNFGGTITVSNPNPVDFAGVEVTDLGPGCTVDGGNNVTVPKKGTKELTYTCKPDSGASGKNTARAIWDADKYFTETGEATATVPYSFEGVTPTDGKNKTVTVVDDKTEAGASVELGKATWNADKIPTTFTYDLTHESAEGACKAFHNVAKIVETEQTAEEDAKVCQVADLGVVKTVTSELNRSYGWDVDKKLTASSVADDGTATLTYDVVTTELAKTDSSWAMSGEITVKNPNKFAPSTVTVTDDPGLPGVACTVADAEGVQIGADAEKTFTYTCAFPDTYAGPTEGTNTATVTWTDQFGQKRTSTGTAPFTATVHEFQKTVTVSDPQVDKTWTYTWTAEGTKHTESVTLTPEEKIPAGSCKAYTNTANLADGEHIIDTVTTEDQTLCLPGSASAVAAAGAYDRDHAWAIEKSVDQDGTESDPQPSGTEFTYTVKVSHTSATDTASAPAKLTLSNPNDFKALKATVTVPEGCTATPASVTIAKSGTADVAVTCATLPTGDAKKVEASVTFTDEDGKNPTTTKVDVPFTLGAETNATVSVKDAFAGSSDLNIDEKVAVADAPKTFTYAVTHKAPAGECKQYDNTATIVETEQTASESAKVCSNPGIELVKHSELVTDEGTADKADVGDVIKYWFTVSNTGNVPLTGVTIADPKLGLDGAACVADLPVGAKDVKCETEATYTVTQADVDSGKVYNKATATGTTPDDPDVPVTDDDDEETPTPDESSLALLKTVASVTDSNNNGINDTGDVITWNFSVTNTGKLTLTDVTVTDAFLGLKDAACVDSLAPGVTATCETKPTYTITDADVKAGSVKNVATAMGKTPDGKDVPSNESDTETPTKKPAPALELVKHSEFVTDEGTTGKADVGDVIKYWFTVSNTGNVPLADVTITDPKLGLDKAACVASLPTGAKDVKCEAEATYTVTQADVDAGKLYNVAKAVGIDPNDPDTPIDGGDDNEVPTPDDSKLDLLKKVASVKDVNGNGVNDTGDIITWSFEVTNRGALTLTEVTITDDFLGLKDAACVATLAPGAKAMCETKPTYTITDADVKAGVVKNVATAMGKTPGGGEVPSDPSSTETKVQEPAPAPTPKPTPPAPPAPKPAPLPQTGTVVSAGVVAGFALMTAAGIALVARRRRSAD